jgi:hypothetical protein
VGQTTTDPIMMVYTRNVRPPADYNNIGNTRAGPFTEGPGRSSTLGPIRNVTRSLKGPSPSRSGVVRETRFSAVMEVEAGNQTRGLRANSVTGNLNMAHTTQYPLSYFDEMDVQGSDPTSIFLPSLSSAAQDVYPTNSLSTPIDNQHLSISANLPSSFPYYPDVINTHLGMVDSNDGTQGQDHVPMRHRDAGYLHWSQTDRYLFPVHEAGLVTEEDVQQPTRLMVSLIPLM